ncbi:ABC transporter ATP-binding protein [Paenibacillus sp. 1P07SE]|uniref:ABC transporter ATP-binding protein n=1 Tax=Paenibacillus sp. 1P07SE TaxID=3132209 RepID=UPI0039A562CE
MSVEPALLSVRHLRTCYHHSERTVTAVDDVSIEVQARQIVALVGESGSGKSATAMSVLGLLDNGGRIEHGELSLGGIDLRGCSERSLNRLRGREMAVIFQDPMNALNPVMPVGKQVLEAVRRQRSMHRKEAKALALQHMQRAGLASPAQLYNRYPFQLSGGMCQRIMIAVALASGARLLIADEPTTALDVTVQAQILGELNRLRHEEGIGILLITHDLGVVAELADYVYVMRAGRIVESGTVYELFEEPSDPYTEQLLAARG